MEMALEIRHTNASFSPRGGVDAPTREAWAAYCRRRWTSNAAKFAAREWDLSLDEARGLVAGRTSLATLDRIHKHKNGGWAVLLPVMGAVIGHGLDDFLEREKQRLQHERQAYEAREARLGQMARDLGAALNLGSRSVPEPALRRRREDREFPGGVGLGDDQGA